MAEKTSDVKQKIDRVETTADCLSGRAGLSLISRYIESIKMLNDAEASDGIQERKRT